MTEVCNVEIKGIVKKRTTFTEKRLFASKVTNPTILSNTDIQIDLNCTAGRIIL